MSHYNKNITGSCNGNCDGCKFSSYYFPDPIDTEKYDPIWFCKNPAYDLAQECLRRLK